MNHQKTTSIIFLLNHTVTLNTGEGAWIAAFTVASYLPQFLISFLGGVWADRYSKKALIIGANAGIALVTLAVRLCMHGIFCSDDRRSRTAQNAPTPNREISWLGVFLFTENINDNRRWLFYQYLLSW